MRAGLGLGQGDHGTSSKTGRVVVAVGAGLHKIRRRIFADYRRANSG